VELLLVVAIIGLLMFVVILAINPRRQLTLARNAQRQSNLQAILNAVYQYTIDNGGLPSTIPTGIANAKQICQFTVVDVATCVAAPINGINLRLLSGSYLTAMPVDPTVTTAGTGSRYMIYRSVSDSRIVVTAPAAELGVTIQVTR